MAKRISHDEFVARVAEINPSITVIGEYKNMHTKIECKCSSGHKWFPIAQDLVRGADCFECAAIKRGRKRAKTHEQFVEEVRAVNPDLIVVGTYKNANTKIEFRCKEGHKWITTPDSVLSGKGCLTCANIQSALRRRKTHEQFVKEVAELHPDITVLGEYVNSKTKIGFMCSKGHIWKTAPYNILDGCSCSICKAEKAAQSRLKTHEQFLEDVERSGADVAILGVYEDSTSKISCQCNKCGHKWLITPNNLLRGYGCPKCCASKGEKKVEEFLTNHKIVFENQKRFDDCRDKRPLPFDFYLPDYNLCIEYQGAQHYMATRRMGDEEKLLYRQEHDRIKREYCTANNINLLEIPYTKFTQIPEILSEAINNGGDEGWQNQSA